MLEPLTPPVLPDAPGVYTAGVFGGMLRLLRIFFVRIARMSEELLRSGGGKHLSFPTGVFTQAGPFSPAAADTAETISLTGTSMVGVTNDSGGVAIAEGGLLLVSGSVRAVGTGAGSRKLSLWWEQDGAAVSVPVDITLTDTVPQVLQFTAVVDVGPLPVNLRCAATNTDLSIEAATAAAGVPAIPAVVARAQILSRTA